MISTVLRHALSALAAVALVFAFAGSPALACDCTNCSAAHCHSSKPAVTFTEFMNVNSAAKPNQLATQPSGSQFPLARE